MFLIWQECFSQVDSTYIRSFSQELSLKVYFIDKYTLLSLKSGNDSDEITYEPNSPYGIGLGFSYKGYSLSGAYGFGFMRDKRKGKTKAADFQYHYYGRKFVMDLYFQKYRRFFTESNEKYKLFPDIRLKQYGCFSQYVFNGNKFSYEAAFDQNKKQLKSSGSFLL